MTTAEAPAASTEKNSPPRTNSRRRFPFLIGAAILIVIVGVLVFYFVFVAPYESTDDAFIDGHAIAIAPQVAGRVARLLITDNQDVKKGDLLVEIDPRDTRRNGRKRAPTWRLRAAASNNQRRSSPSTRRRLEKNTPTSSPLKPSPLAHRRDLKRYQTVEKPARSPRVRLTWRFRRRKVRPPRSTSPAAKYKRPKRKRP